MAEEQQNVETGGKPGIFDNKIIMIVMLVVLQGGMAFAAMKFLIQPAVDPTPVEGEAAAGEAQAEVRQKGVLVSLDEMVVSLSSADRPRYLRTNISVEARDSKAAEAVQERMAEFRDAALMQLSSHSATELISFEGKAAVKAEIKEALKELLDEGEILNIYYSDFVVQ